VFWRSLLGGEEYAALRANPNSIYSPISLLPCFPGSTLRSFAHTFQKDEEIYTVRELRMGQDLDSNAKQRNILTQALELFFSVFSSTDWTPRHANRVACVQRVLSPSLYGSQWRHRNCYGSHSWPQKNGRFSFGLLLCSTRFARRWHRVIVLQRSYPLLSEREKVSHAHSRGKKRNSQVGTPVKAVSILKCKVISSAVLCGTCWCFLFVPCLSWNKGRPRSRQQRR